MDIDYMNPDQTAMRKQFSLGPYCLYSKTCVKRPLKNRQNKELNDMVA